MKRSLFTVLVLLASLALAASAIAGQFQRPVTTCCPAYSAAPPMVKPAKQVVLTETVTKKIYQKTILDQGTARGTSPICNSSYCGSAPAVTWSCTWSCAIQGPPVKATYLVTKKAKLLKVGTGRRYRSCAARGYCPF
jgi:hypothetical protein